MTLPSHLYLHIPFCHRRCSYCDFNTYANMEHRIDAYVQALCAEIGMLAALPCGGEAVPAAAPADVPAAALLSRALRPTIFFGGGTPSMLALPQLEQVMQAAAAMVPLDAAEVTLEANPGSVLGAGTDALDYLRGLRSLGINRLSLGVQSLHDPTLRVLGRTHTAAEARQCFTTARQAGFDNINLDFIFGLPGQTPQQWAAMLDTIATWDADHFSLYSLILEESTPLYAQVLRGQVHVPDDDATAAMYECALERLAAAGFAQYEISNWARPRTPTSLPPLPNGRLPVPAAACHHNLAYWLNSDYLAAGAGAHGHCYPRRFANVLAVDDYIAHVAAGQRPLAEETPLSPDDLCAETMFMGLRLNAGVHRAHFRRRCGRDLDAAYGPTLHGLQQQGLLVNDEGGAVVRLTERGRMLGNQVFSHFVSTTP
jgi:oxygen-independent coproporphyrinogen-3 oxidase